MGNTKTGAAARALEAKRERARDRQAAHNERDIEDKLARQVLHRGREYDRLLAEQQRLFRRDRKD